MDPNAAGRMHREGCVNATSLSRRLAALERKLSPPGPPSIRDRYPDLPPGAEATIAAAVMDAACALDAATGGASLSVIGPAILLHRARVIEALRAGRPAPGRPSKYREVTDSITVAELLHAVGIDAGSASG
jgi:hypothetical protein